jgi:hypothetical protein
MRARLSAAEAALLAGDREELVVLGQEGGVRVEGGEGEVVMEGVTGAVRKPKMAMRMLLKENAEKVLKTVEEESKAAVKETKKIAKNTGDPDMILYNDEVDVLLCGGGKVLKAACGGKNSELLRIVEKMTDTSIKVLGEKGEVMRPVIIGGSEEGKKKAKEIIKIALIPDFFLNNDEVGYMLREGGKTVAKVMKETNTVISILGKHGQDRHRQRGVRVFGSEKGKEMAKDMILKML